MRRQPHSRLVPDKDRACARDRRGPVRSLGHDLRPDAQSPTRSTPRPVGLADLIVPSGFVGMLVGLAWMSPHPPRAARRAAALALPRPLTPRPTDRQGQRATGGASVRQMHRCRMGLAVTDAGRAASPRLAGGDEHAVQQRSPGPRRATGETDPRIPASREVRHAKAPGSHASAIALVALAAERFRALAWRNRRTGRSRHRGSRHTARPSPSGPRSLTSPRSVPVTSGSLRLRWRHGLLRVREYPWRGAAGRLRPGMTLRRAMGELGMAEGHECVFFANGDPSVYVDQSGDWLTTATRR